MNEKKRFVMNEDLFERSIKIMESRSFLDSKENRLILMRGLCQIDTFKALMRDPSLESFLYPFLDEFCAQATSKYIPKGRILYHDGDNLSSLFFSLRGSFAEFEMKSEEDLQQEIFWDQQAEEFREQLGSVQRTQLQLQEQKKLELLEREKLIIKRGSSTNNSNNPKDPTSNSKNNNNNNDPSNSNNDNTNTQLTQQMTALRQQMQEAEAKERQQARKGGNKPGQQSLKKLASLEEMFFTEDYKVKSTVLKGKSDLYSETAKFYTGADVEDLLKIENKFQDRYFLDNKCLYKKSRTYCTGETFGELHHQAAAAANNSNAHDNEEHQQHNGIGKKHSAIVRKTVVCEENGYILTISSRSYQRVFGGLIERLNYSFHALTRSFPETKKVILSGFAFEFEEQNLEFNQVLFNQGDVPAYVYIMKAGEIDYRKKFTLPTGQAQQKRIGMVNQGELFGHEDLFGNSRMYSVHSCVNNSVVYRIRKEALLIFQFVDPLKASAKARSESLKMKLAELYSRNDPNLKSEESEYDIQEEQYNNNNNNNHHSNKKYQSQQQQQQFQNSLMQSTMRGGGAAGTMNGSMMNMNSSMKQFQESMMSTQQQQMHQTRSAMTGTTAYKQNNNSNQPKYGSQRQLPSMTVIQDYFEQTKNLNFGESDFDLAFQSTQVLQSVALLPDEAQQQQSQGGSNSGGQGITSNHQSKAGKKQQQQSQQQQQQQQQSSLQSQSSQPPQIIGAVSTIRAQPESVYSRIVRPDSAFKEEIDQMKKEKAAALLMFHANPASQQGGHEVQFNSSLGGVAGETMKSQQSLLNRGHSNNNFNNSLNYQQQQQSRPRTTGAGKKGPEFKLNKMFLPSSSSSAQSSGNNPLSGASSSVSTSKLAAANGGQSEVKERVPASLSLSKYKETAKDFFEKKKAKPVDFFMEFQNYKQSIASKLFKSQVEIKEDPYAHIDFDVVGNAKLHSDSKLLKPLNSGVALHSNKEESQLSGVVTATQKQQSRGILSNYSTSMKSSTVNSAQNLDSNSYKSNYTRFTPNTSSRNIPSSSDDIQNNDFHGKEVNSQLRSLSSNNNNGQQQKRIRFAPSLITPAGNASGNGVTSLPPTSSASKSSGKLAQKFQDESVRFHIRDQPAGGLFSSGSGITSSAKQLMHGNYTSSAAGNSSDGKGKPTTEGQLQQSSIANSHLKAERDIENNFQNVLSFGNLRKQHGLRLTTSSSQFQR